MNPQPAFLPLSPVSRRLLRDARSYATVDATVLITGETGVGKDAMARCIHAFGARRDEPFVVVDCPALPATLIESELFGHERGAFTDARTARAGRFEHAGAGTIYLDAIGGLHPTGQGALLRVLEDRQVTRLGGTHGVTVRARVIASTEAAVEDLVRSGVLRADLFHRLNVLPLRIPPLRERRAEIVPLARHFVVRFTGQARMAPTLSADAQDALARYHWPGNVRELSHVMQRALLVTAGEHIAAADLPKEVLEQGDLHWPPAIQPPTLAEVERRYIALTLQLTKGSQTRAAAILGISRKGLWEKRKRYAL